MSGSFVLNSVLFTNVRVHSFCTLDQAVIFPGVEIGAGYRLRRVVVDKGCKLPDGLVVGRTRTRMHAASTAPSRASCW